MNKSNPQQKHQLSAPSISKLEFQTTCRRYLFNSGTATTMSQSEWAISIDRIALSRSRFVFRLYVVGFKFAFKTLLSFRCLNEAATAMLFAFELDPTTTCLSFHEAICSTKNPSTTLHLYPTSFQKNQTLQSLSECLNINKSIDLTRLVNSDPFIL